MNKLEVRDITTGYDGKTILRNVSFSVASGEVLAILGQNGSGKSTLLKTIARIISDNSGSIIIDDVGIDDVQPWDLREHGVAYSMQTGMIFPSLTVSEHFRLVLRKTDQSDAVGIYESCFVHFPELRDLLEKRAGNLSGGQRQILGLAMLLCQRANIWLLDEPTAGLAPNAVKRSVKFLMDMKTQGQTMLLVEHNYPVAYELADHVAIVKDGNFSECYARSEFQKEDFLDRHLYV